MEQIHAEKSRFFARNSVNTAPLRDHIRRTAWEFFPRLSFNARPDAYRTLQGQFATVLSAHQIPTQIVQKWLPDGVEMSGGDVHHPVILAMGEQRDVHQTLLGVGLHLPFGVRYGELIVIVPDLLHTGATGRCRNKLYSYVPRLYVAHPRPTLYGRILYQYPKQVADIEYSHHRYKIYSEYFNESILEANYDIDSGDNWDMADAKMTVWNRYLGQEQLFKTSSGIRAAMLAFKSTGAVVHPVRRGELTTTSRFLKGWQSSNEAPLAASWDCPPIFYNGHWSLTPKYNPAKD